MASSPPLSCLPVSYFKALLDGRMPLTRWAAEAAGLGLDAIDLSRLFLEGRRHPAIRALRRAIEAEGVSVLVLNTYPDFTHPSPAARRRAAGALRHDLRRAELLGARIVRVTAGQAHPETRRADGLRWAADGLQAASDSARAHGVTLALENHSKPGIWDHYDFAYATGVFLDLVRALRGSPVRVLFDTANTLAYGDDPLPVLEAVYDRVVCLHAADTAARGAFQPTVIGRGAVPFRALFHFLKHAGYAGWISIEEAGGAGPTGVRQAVDFIRSTWHKA